MNNKPRILFIAPASYPIFGAEANVNAKLLKTLGEGGAIIDLVCREIRKEEKGYPESRDDFYFSKINSINNISTEPKHDIKTILRYCRCLIKFGVVYSGIDWSIDALPICENLIRNYTYDYIYTFNQPSEVLGVFLSRKYNIPWVATWNDPYVWSKYPKPYGLGPYSKLPYFRNKLVKKIEKHCSYHIFPSKRLMEYMKLYMATISIDNSFICPHIMLTKNKRIRETDKVLRIIHSGALGKERDPRSFLRALRHFLDVTPDAKIEITFIGVFERTNKTGFYNFINDKGLKNYVKFIPPVTYKDSLSILSHYDISLIIEANCDEGIFLPSKVADYMQEDIPIFTISPRNGVLKDLFNDGFIEYYADVSDEKNIQTTLQQIYKDFSDGKLKHIRVTCDLFTPKSILKQHTKIWH